MSLAPRAILILGMHRSGTSALANLLSTLGVDFGRNLIPASPANELGFFEKAEIVDANERLLQALGLEDANDPRPLPRDWRDYSACGPIRRDVLAILRADFDGVPLWAVKDPRICRLVPFWIDIVRELGSEPSFIHVTRNPLEIADSLAVRQGLDPRRVQFLWLRHVLEAVRATRGGPRVFVTYGELISDWQETADRIAETLDLTWPNKAVVSAETIEKVLPGRLRHHHRADEDLGEEEGVARWVATAYRALAALRDGSESTHVRRLNEIRRNLDAADELLVGTDTNANPANGPPAELRYAGTLRWDQGQLDARSTVGEIVAGKTLELEFVANHENFCGFDLLFGTYARTNTSSLDVELLVANADAELEAQYKWSLRASEIENDAWRAFRCAPQAEIRGRQCVIRLCSGDAAAGDAVTLYCDPDGRLAYRAYFVELSSPQEREPAHSDFVQLQERVERLEFDRTTREALSSLETRLAFLEPRVDLELGRVGGVVEELQNTVGAASSEMVNFRSSSQADAEWLRAELAHQRGRLEAVPEQFRVLRELLSSTREAGDAERRADHARLTELERELSSILETAQAREETLRATLEEASRDRFDDLERSQSDQREWRLTHEEAMDARFAGLESILEVTRRQEETLRTALEEASLDRSGGFERIQSEERQWRLTHEEAMDERFARLESIVLSAVERINALGRRADRDLAAIGAALEEAWQ